ncbi:hypothetical protein L596_017455 [Steinernema carpocapsae]|uniref:Uncharacterized protein n=1 Tax=Steinernema carpocapsae TaxID=34508 RepID=A0A4U5N1R0_STECR|nr:hypothetical protein L596_017455 [Steinernema carpocapsae]
MASKALLLGLFAVLCIAAIYANPIVDCARACAKEEIKTTECPAHTVKRLNHCSCTEVCDKKTTRDKRDIPTALLKTIAG